METKIGDRTPSQYTTCLGEPIGPDDPVNVRERKYWMILQISDDDFEHGHEEGYHSFPCTPDQLRALRDQIDARLRVIGAQA